MSGRERNTQNGWMPEYVPDVEKEKLITALRRAEYAETKMVEQEGQDAKQKIRIGEPSKEYAGFAITL